MKISTIVLSTLSFCNAAPVLDQAERELVTNKKILKEAIITNYANYAQDEVYNQKPSSSNSESQTSGNRYGSQTWSRTSDAQTNGGTYNWQTSGKTDNSQIPNKSADYTVNRDSGSQASSGTFGRQDSSGVENVQLSGCSQAQCDTLEQRVQSLETHHQVNDQIIGALVSTFLQNQETFVLSLRTAQGRMDELRSNQNQQQNNGRDRSNDRLDQSQQDARQTQWQQGYQPSNKPENTQLNPIQQTQDQINYQLELQAKSNSVHKLFGVTRSNPNKGVLMVKYNGEWGTVCDDNFTQREADVACRGMGYTGAISFSNVNQSRGYSSPDGANILMDEVECPYNAASLFDCTAKYTTKFQSHNCQHGEDIVVACHKVA